MNDNIKHFKRQLATLKRNKVLSKATTEKQIARFTKAIEDGILDFPEYPETTDMALRERAIKCGVLNWAIAEAAHEAANNFCQFRGFKELFKMYVTLYEEGV